MLPRFPGSKTLDLSDSDVVRDYTSGCPPFSDFNFGSLWSWDVDENVRLSELNGNLVVRFTDYATGKLFYSFLGKRDVNATVATLLDWSAREGLEPQLKLIADVVAEQLDVEAFSITEDPGHADYVLSVDRLCSYEGGRLASKRNEQRKFLNLFPRSQFNVLDLNNSTVISQCRQLFYRWHSQKRSLDHDAGRERNAFERCLSHHTDLQLIGAGVFVDGCLVAFSLSEFVGDGYAFTHFEKADTQNFPGISAFLNQQLANMLRSQGIQFINIEQDLGMPGLRLNKRSYHPCQYLKKFSVSYRSIGDCALQVRMRHGNAA